MYLNMLLSTYEILYKHNLSRNVLVNEDGEIESRTSGCSGIAGCS